MSAYHSRLRQLATTCEFADLDKEIKSQIIFSCSSQRLRRKALRDTTLTLETRLNEARALEISETQAKDIESSGNANAVLPKPVQKPPSKGNCYNCVDMRRSIRDSDIQVRDTVLVKQPKRGKLSTPYHPIPLTVTSKNHSMLTAEGGDRKVTRNSSHFKKFFSDEPASSSLSDADLPKPLTSPLSASQDDIGSVLVDPNTRTPADPQLRRSSRVSKPPLRLIQEI